MDHMDWFMAFLYIWGIVGILGGGLIHDFIVGTGGLIFAEFAAFFEIGRGMVKHHREKRE